MNFLNQKYELQLDEMGAVMSLKSMGKQFIKQRLPLFVFQLRDGGNTQIINSDQAQNITLCDNGDNIKIKYEFNNEE